MELGDGTKRSMAILQVGQNAPSPTTGSWQQYEAHAGYCVTHRAKQNANPMKMIMALPRHGRCRDHLLGVGPLLGAYVAGIGSGLKKIAARIQL